MSPHAKLGSGGAGSQDTTGHAGLVPFLVTPAGSCSVNILWRLTNEGPKAPGRKLCPETLVIFLELGNLQLLLLQMKQNKRFTVAKLINFSEVLINWTGINIYTYTHYYIALDAGSC